MEAWPDATFSLLKFYFIFIDIAIFIDVSFSKDNLEKYMNVLLYAINQLGHQYFASA